MNPMQRLREIAIVRFGDTNKITLAATIGVARNTLQRFLKGSDGSYKVAKWMAEEYGGECVELYASVKERSREYRSLNIARGRAERLRSLRHEEGSTPCPSMVVDMVRSEPETHIMPPIDSSDILCYTLPVLYPQPEVSNYV